MINNDRECFDLIGKLQDVNRDRRLWRELEVYLGILSLGEFVDERLNYVLYTAPRFKGYFVERYKEEPEFYRGGEQWRYLGV